MGGVPKYRFILSAGGCQLTHGDCIFFLIFGPPLAQNLNPTNSERMAHEARHRFIMQLFLHLLANTVLRGENGNPLQYSSLINPMDRGAWWAAVHGVTKSWTRLSTHVPPVYACTHISLYSANTIVLNLIGLFIVGLKEKKKPAN